MADPASSGVDPRSPRVRLEAFFDPGTFRPITPEDDRGVRVGVGSGHGAGGGVRVGGPLGGGGWRGEGG